MNFYEFGWVTKIRFAVGNSTLPWQIKVLLFFPFGLISFSWAILSFPFRFIWGICQIVFAFFEPWFAQDRAFSTGILIGLLCPILFLPIWIIATIRWARD